MHYAGIGRLVAEHQSLDVLDHCTFEDKFAFFIFLLVVVRFVLPDRTNHPTDRPTVSGTHTRGAENGTELTYFHPTWVLHF